MEIKRYSELIRIPSFEERYQYLKLYGIIGEETFGCNRRFNQDFYHSKEWRAFRRQIILRDNGCDLAHPEHPISGMIIVHHLVPITLNDIQEVSEYLMNPEYAICVSDLTHRAITYGYDDLLPKPMVERSPYDTCPWRKIQNG